MSIFRDLFNVKQSPILSVLGFGGGGTGLTQSGAALPGTLTIKMWGASGGGWQTKGWGSPAPGSSAGALRISDAPYDELGISSGDTLYVYVGGTCSGNSGGPNGGRPGSGGSGAGNGRGGGGCTSIYRNGTHSTGTLMLVAGGSGGSQHLGGFGYYPTGAPANTPPGTGSPTLAAATGDSVGGGTQGTGGRGSEGGGYPNGSPGSAFNGGPGSPTGNGAGGGGGAGYYGGGGGHGDTGAANGSGGGGGSNYQNPGISATVSHFCDFIDVPNYLGVDNSSLNISPSGSWPSIWSTYYPTTYPASSTPGFMSNDPDYSAPRCGAGNDGPSNGMPGSVVFIDVDGNKTTLTYTGSQQTYSVP